MKVNRYDLQNALSVLKDTNKNPPLPDLNFARIKAGNGKLNITTTNLEVATTVAFDVEETKEATGMLLSDVFYKLVKGAKKSSKESVDVELGKAIIKLTIDDIPTELTADASAENFPEIPTSQSDDNHIIFTDRDQIIRSANYILRSVSKDSYRENLRLVLLNLDTESLISADGHRMHLGNVQFEDGSLASIPQTYEKWPHSQAAKSPARWLLLPELFVKQMVKVLKLCDKECKPVLSLSEDYIYLYVGDWVITAGIPQATYPDYRQVMPKEHSVTSKVEREMLIKAIKRAKILDLDRVVLDIEKEIISIKSQDDKTTIKINAESNKATHLGINPDYVLDAIDKIKNEYVTICCEDENSPPLFENSNGLQAVVMPMRLEK